MYDYLKYYFSNNYKNYSILSLDIENNNENYFIKVIL
jgi:hypothetical protein